MGVPERRLSVVFYIAVALCFLGAATGEADTIIFDAVRSGSVAHDGSLRAHQELHGAGFAPITANTHQVFRNFFTFDLSAAPTRINSATLRIEQAGGGLPDAIRAYVSSDLFETFAVYDVNATAADVDQSYAVGSPTGLSIYNDLGTSSFNGSLGSVNIEKTTGPHVWEVSLNQNGIDYLNSRRGEMVVLGGAVTTLRDHPPPLTGADFEGVFADHLGVRQLVIEASGPVVEPPPVVEQKQIPLPAIEPNAKNIIVIAHGVVSNSGFDFDKMKQLAARIGESVNDDWDVIFVDWSSLSMSNQPANSPVPVLLPHLTRVNRLGREVGASLGTLLHDSGYQNVHLIGHSAGAALVQTAVDQLRLLGNSGHLHSTFLDPYLGPSLASANDYGRGASWSDTYWSDEPGTGLWTNGPIEQSYSVNVDISADSRSHTRPIEFYLSSVDAPSHPTAGFSLALEAGADLGALPPVEDSVQLFDLSFEPTLTIDLSVSLVDLIAVEARRSATGHIALQSNAVTMSTGSPAWIEFLITSTDPANFLRFDLEFIGGSQGAFGVYWDDLLLASFDQRFSLPGIQEYRFLFPDVLDPGSHTLGFRLDAYSADGSSLRISDVQTGLLTVDPIPEPTSLLLVALGVGVLMRRRKRAA